MASKEFYRKKVLFIAGTRPNFMKVAPLLRECKKHNWIEPILVHTGQHYDDSLSKVFFRELDIQTPDITLNAGEISDYEKQKESIAQKIYNEYKDSNISAVVVVGDVNSTVSGALAGKRLGVPIAHVEAGLRSFDDRMPEEHNRILVDSIASILFITEPSGFRNLRKYEPNIKNKNMFLVGNVMIDTLYFSLPEIKKLHLAKKMGLKKKSFA